MTKINIKVLKLFKINLKIAEYGKIFENKKLTSSNTVLKLLEYILTF